MPEYSRTELEEAHRAISSTIRKCEKVQETLSRKQPQPTAQLTLLVRRLAAFRLALALVTRELEGLDE